MDLRDILRGIHDDPETRRVEEERQQHFIKQARAIASRPRSGQISPTDQELLRLISDLFNEVYLTTPFNEDYDQLIERLSFTDARLDDVGASELKTAWKRFLDASGLDFPWPLNVGMAVWYARCGMVSHAIAVYEYLYFLIRRGELSGECAEEDFGTWLIHLLNLCRQRGLAQRARHLCEVIEDFYNDGCVSIETYFESLHLLPELTHSEIRQTVESERRSAEQKLLSEHGPLIPQLYSLTRKLAAEAELWSSPHWRRIEPLAAPLLWSLALESEFHYKVFEPNRGGLQAALGDRAPRQRQTCGLGHIIDWVRGASSNIGVKVVLAGCRGADFLVSKDTLNKLQSVREHRDDIAHVRGKPYSAHRCSEFLIAIRDSGWVFEFLSALQHR